MNAEPKKVTLSPEELLREATQTALQEDAPLNKLRALCWYMVDADIEDYVAGPMYWS